MNIDARRENSIPLAAAHPIPFREAVWVWLKIGLMSFGGPAGQIALMHRMLVEERRWIGEARFLHALNYCMLLPGPEAMQLATYIGWLLHRLKGGLVAGFLFVMPGFCVILGFSALYAGFREIPAAAAAFYGIKAAVLAVVIEALVRIGRRALTHRLAVVLAGAAFIAIFFLQIPFPVIILGAAVIGPILARVVPGAFAERKRATAAEDGPTRSRRCHHRSGARTAYPPRFPAAFCYHRGLRHALAFSCSRHARCIGSRACLCADRHFLFQDGGRHLRRRLCGAFVVAQQAVEVYGWLGPGEMLDGLGLAETTPGPLILVLEFVGFLAAFRDPGTLAPMLAGLFGAALTVWVLVPCFLWIFAGAPYVEAIRGRAGLSAALAAITAAVVGVILNLCGLVRCMCCSQTSLKCMRGD